MMPRGIPKRRAVGHSSEPGYTARVATVFVPDLLPPSLNTYTRMHWRQQRALHVTWAQAIHAYAKYRPKGIPMARCAIFWTRCASRLMDWTNMIGGLKPVEDALCPSSARHPAGLGWIEDDAPACVVEVKYAQLKVGREERGLLIEVREVLWSAKDVTAPAGYTDQGIGLFKQSKGGTGGCGSQRTGKARSRSR